MEWIKVKDKLPEFHKDILFFIPRDNIDQTRIGAFYRRSHKFRSDSDVWHKDEVSHWMPIPEAPTI